MAQADAERSTARVYQYPTQRTRPIRQPKGAMARENWPANVQCIRPPITARPKVVIPPTGFVVLALIRANATRKRKAAKPACLMDVHQELDAMVDRFRAEGDMEAAAAAYAAIDLLWAGRTGRW